jgi:hypothetical protein
LRVLAVVKSAPDAGYTEETTIIVDEDSLLVPNSNMGGIPHHQAGGMGASGFGHVAKHSIPGDGHKVSQIACVMVVKFRVDQKQAESHAPSDLAT